MRRFRRRWGWAHFGFEGDVPALKPMWHGGHFRCVLLAAFLAAASGFALPATAQRVSEYQVKAAYLYQFLNFVEWPPRSAGAADASYEICILGIDPFGSDLDAAVQG